MNKDIFQHTALTKDIIRLFYRVYNTLGSGFLEKVYKNALYLELKSAGYNCEAEKPINVYYNNVIVGNYYADIVVENKVILELKACEMLTEAHEAQLLNYLKATDIELGLLLNFGPYPEIMRRAYSNENKKHHKQ